MVCGKKQIDFSPSPPLNKNEHKVNKKCFIKNKRTECQNDSKVRMMFRDFIAFHFKSLKPWV